MPPAEADHRKRTQGLAEIIQGKADKRRGIFFNLPGQTFTKKRVVDIFLRLGGGLQQILAAQR